MTAFDEAITILCISPLERSSLHRISLTLHVLNNLRYTNGAYDMQWMAFNPLRYFLPLHPIAQNPEARRGHFPQESPCDNR